MNVVKVNCTDGFKVSPCHPRRGRVNGDQKIVMVLTSTTPCRVRMLNMISFYFLKGNNFATQFTCSSALSLFGTLLLL